MKSLNSDFTFDICSIPFNNSVPCLNVCFCYVFSIYKNRLTDIHIDNIDLYLKDSFIDIAEKYYVYVFNK